MRLRSARLFNYFDRFGRMGIRVIYGNAGTAHSFFMSVNEGSGIHPKDFPHLFDTGQVIMARKDTIKITAFYQGGRDFLMISMINGDYLSGPFQGEKRTEFMIRQAEFFRIFQMKIDITRVVAKEEFYRTFQVFKVSQHKRRDNIAAVDDHFHLLPVENLNRFFHSPNLIVGI